MSCRIHLASDWTGVAALAELTRHLVTGGYEVVQHGPAVTDPGDDYPQFVLAACRALVADQDAGIDAFAVVAGVTRTGVVITANKAKGARAVACDTADAAATARRVDDANVLVIDPTASPAGVADTVDAFVAAPFGPSVDELRRLVQVLEFETGGTIAGWQVEYGEAVLDAGGDHVDPHRPLAAVFRETGSPSVLSVEPVPEVHAAAGEVRVRVKAAGVNPFDAKVRTGRIAMDLGPAPWGIGQDFAGIVDEVGAGAAYYDGAPVRVGDAVLGWPAVPSAMREQLVVAATELARKPPSLSWEAAGSLQTAALTAQAAIDAVPLVAGDVVLVGGATGGVGLHYAQLARLAGATVIGTASAANHAFLTEIGVLPVEYGAGLDERVRALGTPPLTAALDTQGRETVDAAVALGVPASRITTIADHATSAELGLASIGRYRRDPATLERLALLRTEQKIAVPVQTYPLASVQLAYDTLEIGHVRGKVAVRIGG